MCMFLLSLYTENRRVNGSFSLKEHYNSPLYSVMNYTDQLIRGLTMQNAQKVDMLFTETVSFTLVINDDDVHISIDYIIDLNVYKISYTIYI